jgi:hypothetical protein
MSIEPIASAALAKARGMSPGRRASEVLMAAAVDGQSATITVAEIIQALDRRAFGLLLILFGLMNCVPVPPGISSLIGIPLVLVALQMVAGWPAPWLPRVVMRREFRRADVVRVLQSARPVLLRIEKLCRPRYLQVFRMGSTRALGAFLALLAACVIIPLPFTNFLPSLATVIVAVAVIELDGLLLAFGIAFGLGAIAFSATVTAGVAGMLLLGLKALFGG